MTIAEMLALADIKQTMARYTMAGDSLRSADFIAVFADDAVFEAEGLKPSDSFRCEGRDAIGRWFGSWCERSDGEEPVHQATFVRHHLSTCDIRLTDKETARARTYWVAWTDIGPDHAGIYSDEFRLVGTAWLIARRRIREDWRSPESLFVGVLPNSSPSAT